MGTRSKTGPNNKLLIDLWHGADNSSQERDGDDKMEKTRPSREEAGQNNEEFPRALKQDGWNDAKEVQGCCRSSGDRMRASMSV